MAMIGMIETILQNTGGTTAEFYMDKFQKMGGIFRLPTSSAVFKFRSQRWLLHPLVVLLSMHV